LTESVDFDLFPNQENVVKNYENVVKYMKYKKEIWLGVQDVVNAILEGYCKILKTCINTPLEGIYKILKTFSKIILLLCVISFMLGNLLDATYYKSIIDKVVNVFTQTDGSAWRVQLIWAFVIVGIWGSAKVVGLLRLLWGIKSDRF
jgi:hypothetical protein